MGAVACSGQQKVKNDKKTDEQIGDKSTALKQLDASEEAKESHTRPKPKTMILPNKDILQPPLETRTIKLLIINRKFSGLLDLLGSLDQLPTTTIEKLNKLIISRSNLSIMIQNTVKRALKEQKIVKKATVEDETLVFSDQKFGQNLCGQMKQICEILVQLEKDSEFEEAFPILCYSFIDLRVQILTIQSEYDLIMVEPRVELQVKGMDLKKSSFESSPNNLGTTTNVRISLQ